jgi:RecB family endonuclease NucS
MKEDGTVKYNGRLMTDFQHGDLFVLQQKDGGFALVKKNFYDVINE